MIPTATVLAVDDEPKALLLLRNLIEPEGCRVLVATSGAQALEVAAREHPDVVLLDIMMPEMDGFEVCQRLRADPVLAPIPILMLTALDDRASRLRGLENGADDFISKPFDSIELRTRVRTIIRLNRFRHLSEQRARFEAAIAHSPDGIVLAERDGTILHHNPAFAGLLAPAGPVRTSFFDYLPVAAATEIRARLADSPGHSGHALDTGLALARPEVSTVELSHGLVPWEGRKIVLYTVRNVTERKSLELQLLRSQRIELLGQLAGGAIHDVNNILSVISGCAQLIEMKGTNDLPMYLTQITTSAHRGASMLRQLLMFARGEDGELVSSDLASVAAEVAQMVGETFGRVYEVRLLAAANLPPVPADPTQVHQIVLNLCVNARDAMPDGGQLSIGVEHRRVTDAAVAVMGDHPTPGEYVAVSVRDTGTGIPEEIVSRLFDPFFTTKPKGKGTGLGLATVIRLVRRHQGFVTLETKVGQGSCFTCHFPVQPGAAAPRAVPALAESGSADV